ncbi:unnamed protein product [Paramecium primaurelia]|uniref:Uncharacterized protein n=1 Tax=Paramecium primaurelia TaxID=5886 RepID=A0A8S1LQT8_PARPR|nr:unnamed protein product [Paramecium primaurelia]
MKQILRDRIILRMKQWILTDSVSKTIDSLDHFYIPIPFGGTI